MEKWEHCVMEEKVVTFLGEKMFRKEFILTEDEAWRELGDDGWQLVAVVPQPEAPTQFYFKRPKPEQS